MADLIDVKTQKPPVETITVKLTKDEAIKLSQAYVYHYGGSKVATLLKDAANGVLPKPSPYDYLLASANRATF